MCPRKVPILAAFVILTFVRPLSAGAESVESANQGESAFQKDLNLLRQDKKELRKVKKTLAWYKSELQAIAIPKDPKNVAPLVNGYFESDCYSGCEPVSVGGMCPDALFTKLHAVPLPGDVIAGNGKIDRDGFVAEVLAGYVANDGVQSKTLCHAIQQKIPAAGALSINTEACQAAISACRFNARDAEVKKVQAQIDAQSVRASGLEAAIDALEQRTTDGCPDCAPNSSNPAVSDAPNGQNKTVPGAGGYILGVPVSPGGSAPADQPR